MVVRKGIYPFLTLLYNKTYNALFFLIARAMSALCGTTTLFGALFAYREAEVAELFAERKVVSVRVCDELRALEMQCAPLVDERWVNINAHNIGDEHIMCAEWYYVGHTAFKADWTFGDDGRVTKLMRRDSRKLALFKFIKIASRADTAKIGGAYKALCRQVDDKCSALFNKRM